MVMSDRFRSLEADDDDDEIEHYVITPLPDASPPPAYDAPPPPPPDADASVAFSCEYEGAIGALSSSVFRLRVLHDATLEGEVLMPQKMTKNDGDNDAVSRKRPKLSPTMPGLRPQVSRNGDAAAERDDNDDDGLVEYARLHGRVKSLQSHPSYETQALRLGDPYCCYFAVLPDLRLLDDGEDGEDADAEAMTCHVHFRPQSERALRGQWVRSAAKPFWITDDAPCELYYQEIKHEFQLSRRLHVKSGAPASRHEELAVAAVEQNEDSATQRQQQKQKHGEALELHPLTPGLYEFRGFTTITPPPRPPSRPTATSSSPSRRRRRSRSESESLTRDECFVTLRLLPDGTLKGTSRELLRPQSCPLSGTWRANRVKYTLKYKVRGEVGRFQYSGRIEGDRKVLGKWKNVDEGHQEGYNGGKGEFELELTQAVRQSVLKNETSGGVGVEVAEYDDDDDVAVATSNKIRVLTTGKYKLKGCATDDDGYEYACGLSVHLKPGGGLIGTSRELIFDQTRPIKGEWWPGGFRYKQKYIVKDEVGEYKYTGSIDADGGIISGDWANVEEQDKEMRGEKGTFAYGITDARRQWSVHSHRSYPKSFRDGVMLLLLCSSRAHALPISLWLRVFEFCDEVWFVVARAGIKRGLLER